MTGGGEPSVDDREGYSGLEVEEGNAWAARVHYPTDGRLLLQGG